MDDSQGSAVTRAWGSQVLWVLPGRRRLDKQQRSSYTKASRIRPTTGAEEQPQSAGPPSLSSALQPAPITCLAPQNPFPLRGSKLAMLHFRRLLGEYRWGGIAPGILRIGPQTCIKGTLNRKGAQPIEAFAMYFIAKTTSIPVPRVMGTFLMDGRHFIVMEYIDAPSLDRLWRHMSKSDKQRIMYQLKGYIDQLRALQPFHPGKVEAVYGSACFDTRHGGRPFGPFDNVKDFHSFLGHDFVRQGFDTHYSQHRSDFEKIAGRTWKTKFTHCDIAPRNILVREGDIVAIIDWEFSGWYPEYWEYVKGCYSNLDCPDFREMLQGIMDPYPDEHEVQEILTDLYGC